MAKPGKTARRGRRPRAAHAAMTRRELAQMVNERLGRISTDGEMLEYVQTMIGCMAEAMLQGRNIEFRDFGVFEVVRRKARIGRNPRKPDELYPIPAHKIVKFKMARKLAEQLAP